MKDPKDMDIRDGLQILRAPLDPAFNRAKVDNVQDWLIAVLREAVDPVYGQRRVFDAENWKMDFAAACVRAGVLDATSLNFDGSIAQVDEVRAHLLLMHAIQTLDAAAWSFRDLVDQVDK